MQALIHVIEDIESIGVADSRILLGIPNMKLIEQGPYSLEAFQAIPQESFVPL